MRVPRRTRPIGTGRGRVASAAFAGTALTFGLGLAVLTATGGKHLAIAGAADTAVVTDQHVAVPSYFWPGQLWATVTASGTHTGIMVANIDSGVGAAAEPAFATAIAAARTAGIRVVGYVDTNYANRPVAQVQAEIAKYYEWYAVDGIFLDRVPNVCDHVAYYQTLNADVDARPGGKVLVLNPGANVPECYSTAGDVIVNFEGTAAMYAAWTPSAWTAAQPATRFWHVVYDAALADQSAIVATSKQRNAGFVYVTDDWFPNPYDNLPSGGGWASLVAAVRAGAPTTTVATTAPPTSAAPTTAAPTVPPTNAPTTAPLTTVAATVPATTVATTAVRQARGPVAVSPARILDTRSAGGPLGAGRELVLTVRGIAGVPSSAQSVFLNVTAVDASQPTYLTVWPSGEVRPNASSLNPMPDRPSPNLVFARIGADGAVRIFNASGAVHVIADVTGYAE